MLKTLTLIASVSLITLFSFAQKPAISPAPSWLLNIDPDYSKKPAEKEISDGYFLDLADLQVNVPAKTEYHHLVRHIINESGVQSASEVSVEFSPEYEKVIFHYINLIRNGKIISRLTPGQIKVVEEETESGNYQYNNQKRAFVVLEDTHKEDRIDFAYSIVGYNPVFKNKFHWSQYFSYSTPVTNYFISILSDPAKKLNLHLFNQAAAPVAGSVNGLLLHQWKQPVLRAWESQATVPSWFDDYPYITVTEFNNWKEVGEWALGVFNSYNYPFSDELVKKIKELQSKAQGDNDLFTELAIRFVQDQVRYLGFEVGVYSHRPHDPNQVLRQGYGDCKDKSLLLARILQYAKIPAYIALLNTSLRNNVEKEAPSPGVFNHAIVALQRSDGYLFIDPTSSGQRGSLINLYIPAYGKALVIKPGVAEFSDVAPGPVNNTIVEESLDVKFPGEGNSTLKVNTEYFGGAADMIREYYSSNSHADIVKQYEDYYAGIYDSIKMVGDINFKDDSVANKILIEENYIIPEIWTYSEEGKKEMPVVAKAIMEKLISPKNHYGGAPLSLNYPADLRYSIKIRMPQDWSFPIEPLELSTNSYSYKFSPAFSGNRIELNYAFKTLKDHIPADEVTAFKTDYKKIDNTLQFELYKNTTDTGNQPKITLPGQNIYWPAVLLCMIIGSGGYLLFHRYNRYYIPGNSRINYEDKFNAWTIFLGITLVISLLFQVYNFIKNDFFNLSNYKTLQSMAGNGLMYTSLLELVLSATWITANLALVYWFFKKRDIFPRIFMYYIASIVVGNLLLLITYKFVNIEKYVPGTENSTIRDIFRILFYGMIWVPYTMRSENVKQVFIKTHDE
ncbi:DUF3857 domain-containing protein [Flavihumibacter profundi]|uniref:DUF3857 domain-containing protein n=1 Tax=Flavihumibacter profundi TaxID=2716883 RepID=UPI001CC5E336|nr:DUF3857 domain-containing protein [Flavihumibacter profundi]MBZ5855860.1 DUF3857 domain-containing protein [Flavihumibacter profundi]